MDFERCAFFTDKRRGRAELKFAGALDLVQPEVAEHHPIAVDTRRQHLSALLAANSAHLKHIGKIDPVEKIDLDIDRRANIISKHHAMKERGFSKHPSTLDTA